MDRKIAFEILGNVLWNNAYSNIELNNALNRNDITDQDAKFITNIVYGVLQNYGFLKYQTEGYTQKPNRALDLLMVMAAYEIEFLRVPRYATVNEYVNLGKERNLDKVLNAVLRKYETREVKFDDPMKNLAINTSHPEWLVKMIEKHYGQDVVKAFCYANNMPPKNVARINRLRANEQYMLNEGFKKTKLSPDGYEFDGNIAYTDAFVRGCVTIQDESSQLVALSLDPKPGQTVLDMCAAPGSKTTHMGQLMKNEGKIYAFDIHPHKIDLINKAAERLGITNIIAAACDATKLDTKFESETFDKILVDAPCSGIGVIRRKPEIKLRDLRADFDQIIDIQKKLLITAAKLVKVNGEIVYSTCTLNKKENEKQIEEFMKSFPNFRLVEQKTILPNEYDSDGFYIAKLVKEA